MRVLFVPAGEISHIVPLAALCRLLLPVTFTCAFLIPQRWHAVTRRLGLRVLDLDHEQNFRTETRAYGLFSPDVVVDDFSLTTRYATQIAGLPRVAIQRTGIFPGGAPRDPTHRHTSGIDLDGLEDVTAAGFRQPRHLSDLFDGTLKLVPGVRSVEVLPEALRGDESYRFCGPLHLEDHFIASPADVEKPWERQGEGAFSPLAKFFAANLKRQKVYVTLGTVEKTSSAAVECVRYLLRRGCAVVATLAVHDLSADEASRFFTGFFLPSHYVCRNVDLVVHHCGNGTYHYPILHGLPAITIGTQYHDREDVAFRLAELGVSIHLKAPAQCPTFSQQFEAAVEQCLDRGSVALTEMLQRVAALRAEVVATSRAFDFAAELREAIRRFAAESTRKARKDAVFLPSQVRRRAVTL